MSLGVLSPWSWPLENVGRGHGRGVVVEQARVQFEICYQFCVRAASTVVALQWWAFFKAYVFLIRQVHGETYHDE